MVCKVINSKQSPRSFVGCNKENLNTTTTKKSKNELVVSYFSLILENVGESNIQGDNDHALLTQFKKILRKNFVHFAEKSDAIYRIVKTYKTKLNK